MNKVLHEFSGFRSGLYGGVVGEKWHFLRTSLTTVLTSPKTINDFLPQMEEIADDWCHLIKQKRNLDGRIDNLEELAGRLGLETTCALVLGKRTVCILKNCSPKILEIQYTGFLRAHVP